jgi:putative transcriptional regulator
LAIIITIDVMLAKRKMSVTELADRVGITIANISVLKNGKAKAIRLSTLEAICKALQCQPGDILEYNPDGQEHAGQAEDQRHTAFQVAPVSGA